MNRACPCASSSSSSSWPVYVWLVYGMYGTYVHHVCHVRMACVYGIICTYVCMYTWYVCNWHVCMHVRTLARYVCIHVCMSCMLCMYVMYDESCGTVRQKTLTERVRSSSRVSLYQRQTGRQTDRQTED